MTNQMAVLISEYGSSTRSNLFIKAPYTYTYPPSYNTAYSHKCSLTCSLIKDDNFVDGQEIAGQETTNPNWQSVATS